MGTLTKPVQPITPLAVIPTVVDTDPSLQGSVFHLDGGNACEVMGKVSAGTGNLYLFRNREPGSTEWYPLDVDAQDLKSIQLDSTKPAGVTAGYFSGTWLTGDRKECGGASYVLVYTGTPTFTNGVALVAQRRL